MRPRQRNLVTGLVKVFSSGSPDGDASHGEALYRRVKVIQTLTISETKEVEECRVPAPRQTEADVETHVKNRGWGYWLQVIAAIVTLGGALGVLFF